MANYESAELFALAVFFALSILICLGVKFCIIKQSALYLFVKLLIEDAKIFLTAFTCCALLIALDFEIILIIFSHVIQNIKKIPPFPHCSKSTIFQLK